LSQSQEVASISPVLASLGKAESEIYGVVSCLLRKAFLIVLSRVGVREHTRARSFKFLKSLVLLKDFSFSLFPFLEVNSLRALFFK
jgi:hypothetical protein